jgi:hypothetical protein
VGVYAVDPARPHLDAADAEALRQFVGRMLTSKITVPTAPGIRALAAIDTLSVQDTVAQSAPLPAPLPTLPSEWSAETRAVADLWIAQRFLPQPEPPHSTLPPGADGILPPFLLPPFVASGFDLNAQWFPANQIVVDSGVDVSFTLSTPDLSEKLIDDYHTPTYWTCKWMHYDNYVTWYAAWLTSHGPESASQQPAFKPVDLKLDFSVAGIQYRWYEGSTIERVGPVAD